MMNPAIGGAAAMHRARVRDAGAALTTPPQPGARNAAAGLDLVIDEQGRVWADNGGQLQLLYEVQSGDSLSRIAGALLGNPARWPDIRNVPQNRALQGPRADAGLFPGDVILIPGLNQPERPPLAPSSSTAPTAPTAPAPGPLAIPEIPGQTTPITPGSPGPALPGPLEGATVVVDKTGSTTTTNGGFWTPGKIAVAGIGGAAVVGGIIYMVTRR